MIDLVHVVVDDHLAPGCQCQPAICRLEQSLAPKRLVELLDLGRARAEHARQPPGVVTRRVERDQRLDIDLGERQARQR